MLVLYHTATLDTATLDGLSPNTGAHCTSTSNTGRASWLRSLWQVLALRQMEGQPVLMPRYDRCIPVDEFRSGQFPRDNGCVAQNVGGGFGGCSRLPFPKRLVVCKGFPFLA